VFANYPGINVWPVFTVGLGLAVVLSLVALYLNRRLGILALFATALLFIPCAVVIVRARTQQPVVFTAPTFSWNGDPEADPSSRGVRVEKAINGDEAYIVLHTPMGLSLDGFEPGFKVAFIDNTLFPNVNRNRVGCYLPMEWKPDQGKLVIPHDELKGRSEFAGRMDAKLEVVREAPNVAQLTVRFRFVPMGRESLVVDRAYRITVEVREDEEPGRR
jgi:hypothetical protein